MRSRLTVTPHAAARILALWEEAYADDPVAQRQPPHRPESSVAKWLNKATRPDAAHVPSDGRELRPTDRVHPPWILRFEDGAVADVGLLAPSPRAAEIPTLKIPITVWNRFVALYTRIRPREPLPDEDALLASVAAAEDFGDGIRRDRGLLFHFPDGHLRQVSAALEIAPEVLMTLTGEIGFEEAEALRICHLAALYGQRIGGSAMRLRNLPGDYGIVSDAWLFSATDDGRIIDITHAA
jgi:hypothetical protein